MHWFPLEFFYLLIFCAGMKLMLGILGSTLFCHVFLLYYIGCFVEGICFSWHHILALIWLAYLCLA